MQWLIDIIMALVDIKCAENKVRIHGQLGAFDRGDPAAFDFTLVDFTTDAGWHDLDLSAIVPADTQFVVLYINILAPAISSWIRFRNADNVQGANISRVQTILANIGFHADVVCPVNSARHISYRASNVFWTLINCTVKGWWLR